jgi:Ca-activated chloride channel family protein
MRYSRKYVKKSLSPLALAVAVVAASIVAPIVLAKRPRQAESESWGIQSGRPRRAGDEQRPGDNQRPGDRQQDDKAIKLTSDLVTVLTSVSDASGNHVDDLGKNDFTVLEDNRPQDIAALYREDQMPLRLIFLFDTSLSIKHRFDFEQRAAARFFQQVMRPGDQAAIMSVSTDSRLETQFTSNVNKLVDTLSHLQPGGATSLYNAMIDSAKYLRPAEGRHVMVVLSDGADTISSATLAQALTEVQKSDAMIFAVHSTGIAPSANVQDLGGEYVLKFMCEDTGGRAFFPPIYEDQAKEARDLDEIYRRLAAEVRAQYVLTYYSNSPSRDGHFRAIKVEVKRAGVQVRARRGYYSPKPQ